MKNTASTTIVTAIAAFFLLSALSLPCLASDPPAVKIIRDLFASSPPTAPPGRFAAESVVPQREVPASQPAPTAAIRTIPLKTGDLVSVGGKIYAGIVSGSPQYPQSLAVIDPATCIVEQTLPLQGEPEKLAVSQNGQYLYVALFGEEGKVLRFLLPSLEKDPEFALGGSFYGQYAVEDMEVLPDSPRSVIIAGQNRNSSPGNRGIAVYDDAVKRPVDIDAGPNVIEIAEDGTCYGYNIAAISAAETDPDPTNNAVETLSTNPYFPLLPGYTWTFATTDGETVTWTVLSGTENILGRMTYVISQKGTGGREYYSNGTDGILLHRQYQQGIRIPGVGKINLALTYNPPITFGTSDLTVGKSVVSVGTARTNRIRGRVLELPYQAEFTPMREQVTVPRGTYEVIRLKGKITLYGEEILQDIFLAPNIGVVKETFSSFGAGESLELTGTNLDFHNLAVQSVKVPGAVVLKNGKARKAKITAEVRNRSPHPEYIRSAQVLDGLVSLSAESFGTCSPPKVEPAFPVKYPVVIQPNKATTLTWGATFDCANDGQATSAKNPGHDDFSFFVTVNHAAMEGLADDNLKDDVCPRQPDGADKGCGGRMKGGLYGAPLITDIIVR